MLNNPGVRLTTIVAIVIAALFAVALFRTRRGDEVAPLPAAAHGTCWPGDQFVFATDAVAAWLMRSVEAGCEPDWNEFHTIDDGAWRLEIERLRAEHRIANDDCTLLSLRIMEPTAKRQIAEPGADGAG